MMLVPKKIHNNPPKLPKKMFKSPSEPRKCSLNILTQHFKPCHYDVIFQQISESAIEQYGNMSCITPKNLIIIIKSRNINVSGVPFNWYCVCENAIYIGIARWRTIPTIHCVSYFVLKNVRICIFWNIF